MRRLVALGAALLALAGCGTLGGPVVDLYAVKATYAAAQTAAVRYAEQPWCSATALPPACSDRDVVAKLVKLDDEATSKLAEADTDAAAFAAAQSAVDAFAAALPKGN